MKKFLALLLAASMMMALVACGSNGGNNSTANNGGSADDTGSEGGDTIKIALIGNTTGDYAQYGIPVRNGAMLYIDQLNANGGINASRSKSWNTTTRATAWRRSTPSTWLWTRGSPL